MTVPIGEVVQQPGLCTRLLNWDAVQAGQEREQVCGESAVIHVAYDAGIENGFCCTAHWVEFEATWPYWDSHDVKAPPCGYPESLWNFDEKRCDWPEGHPLAEIAAAEVVSV